MKKIGWIELFPVIAPQLKKLRGHSAVSFLLHENLLASFGSRSRLAVRAQCFKKRLAYTSVPVRNAIIHVEEKISRLPNGLTVASVDLGGPVAQLVVAYRAGTRYEMPDEAGLVHHIRNCIGRDSQRYYGAQLLWQCGSAGANVNAVMTRDLLAVQMSVIRNRAAVGLSLLGELAQPAFKPWDVEDSSETLRIDRNYLKAYDVLVEDLHDVIFRLMDFNVIVFFAKMLIEEYLAAFRNGSLGNYLYAKEESTGKFSHRKMEKFARRPHFTLSTTFQASQMVTGNAVLVGVNISHDQILDYASSQFTITGSSNNKPSDAEVRFSIASEARYNQSLAVQAVLSAFIGQGAAAKYAVGVGQGTKASSGYPFGISSISEVYADEGLVGVYIVSEADHIGPENMVLDRAAQILATGKAETVSDLLREITFISMADITKGFENGLSDIGSDIVFESEVVLNDLTDVRLPTIKTKVKLLQCRDDVVHSQKCYSSPTWDSIDSRPIPQWYQNAKLGIFCHWGIYSVPAIHSEWMWYAWKISNSSDIIQYMNRYYKPGVTYADLAQDFTAEHFNASMFQDIVEASGARSFEDILCSQANIMKASQCGQAQLPGTGIQLMLALTEISLFSERLSCFLCLATGELKNAFLESKYVSYPQMLEIVRNYEPEIIWSDGDWEMSDDYWKSKEFIAWLYNSSPVKDIVAVNDRWGEGISGKHGGFLTYSDRFDPGYLLRRKWENCLTLDKKSWGYRRNMRSEDVNTVSYLISQLVRTIACNGNMLLNIGPDKSGMIAPIFEDRLRELGRWVKRNREAIFNTYPWMYQNDSLYIWYTISPPSEYKVKNDMAFIPHVENSKLYAFSSNFRSVIPLHYLLYFTHRRKTEFLEVNGISGHSVTLSFKSIKDLLCLARSLSESSILMLLIKLTEELPMKRVYKNDGL
ncbi:Plasma alpha-L-fucosidase [Dirofilaria immitis]|nr:Plasma alpha-L-fucosidase [Dirofilaria immitis]